MQKKDKIRTFRKSLKLTQEEFASILGIGRSSYANVELGINSLTSEHLETLLMKYGFSPIWYLADIGPMIINTQDMMQFFTTMGSINVIHENSTAKINSPVNVNQTVKSFSKDKDKETNSITPPTGLELEIMKLKLEAAQDKISAYEAHIKSLQEMVDILKPSKQ
jgi:transcriptional regulator with XRE-family HTH domain